MSPPSSERVACVDDDRAHGEKLQDILRRQSKLSPGPVFRQVRDVDETPWALVVCDLILPDEECSGPDAVERLDEQGHRVMAWSSVASPEAICDSIAAGALTYVEKTTVWDHPDALVDAVEATVSGDGYMTQDLASRLLSDMQRRPMLRYDLGPAATQYLNEMMIYGPKIGQRPDLLGEIWEVAESRRNAYTVHLGEEDRQILALLAVGFTHAVIAKRIGRSLHDVNNRLYAIRAVAIDKYGSTITRGARTQSGWAQYLKHRMDEERGAHPRR